MITGIARPAGLAHKLGALSGAFVNANPDRLDLTLGPNDPLPGKLSVAV